MEGIGDNAVRLLTEFEKSGLLPSRGLKHYQSLANDLVEACQSGDEGALGRIAEHFNLLRQLSWDLPPPAARIARLRRHILERIGTRPTAATEDAPLPLDDARLLIARSEGFESWPELVKHTGE